MELNRDALDFLSVVPSLRTEGADVIAKFDIYLNTTELFFDDARAVDFGIVLVGDDFDYISYEQNSEFGGAFYAAVNDADAVAEGGSGAIWLSAVATNGYAPVDEADDEPIITLNTLVNTEKLLAELDGSLKIFNAYVDEVAVDDDYEYEFVYDINFLDIIPHEDIIIASE